MHVDAGMQSPCHKREGSPNIEMQTPVKRSKSMEDSQVLHYNLFITQFVITRFLILHGSKLDLKNV